MAARVDDYLNLAGGPTRGADAEQHVRDPRQRQRGQWPAEQWLVQSAAPAWKRLQAEPGDTVFVPEEMDKTTFIQNAKDWTQILYQFGLGVAAILAIDN